MANYVCMYGIPLFLYKHLKVKNDALTNLASLFGIISSDLFYTLSSYSYRFVIFNFICCERLMVRHKQALQTSETLYCQLKYRH